MPHRYILMIRSIHTQKKKNIAKSTLLNSNNKHYFLFYYLDVFETHVCQLFSQYLKDTVRVYKDFYTAVQKIDGKYCNSVVHHIITTFSFNTLSINTYNYLYDFM